MCVSGGRVVPINKIQRDTKKGAVLEVKEQQGVLKRSQEVFGEGREGG